MASVQRVASINLQSDFDEAIRAKDASIFVNSFGRDVEQEFSNVRIVYDASVGDVFSLKSENAAFHMSLAAPAPAGGMRMDAGCDTTGASTCFAAPGQRWTHLHKDRHIAALDASSVAFTRALTGEVVPSLAVSGSAVLGELHVFDAATGASVRQLEGHIGGVGVCRFFPNGNLVISGGADLTLKIWTIAEGLCAATFRGHAGRITSLGIIGRGQSVVSGSSDGHVNLWNCATQQCLRAFKPASVDADLGSVYDCVLADSDNVCLAATQGGCIVGWDLRSGASMFSSGAPSSAVNTICMLPDEITFACGHQDGVLCLFDVRKSSLPLGSWRRSAHAIMRVAAPSPSGDGSLRLLSGSMDGAATEWAMAADGTVSIEREYCGPNCEPVNGLAFVSSAGGAAALATLLSASDDGVVRAYQRD